MANTRSSPNISKTRGTFFKAGQGMSDITLPSETAKAVFDLIASSLKSAIKEFPDLSEEPNWKRVNELSPKSQSALKEAHRAIKALELKAQIDPINFQIPKHYLNAAQILKNKTRNEKPANIMLAPFYIGILYTECEVYKLELVAKMQAITGIGDMAWNEEATESARLLSTNPSYRIAYSKYEAICALQKTLEPHQGISLIDRLTDFSRELNTQAYPILTKHQDRATFAFLVIISILTLGIVPLLAKTCGKDILKTDGECKADEMNNFLATVLPTIKR